MSWGVPSVGKGRILRRAMNRAEPRRATPLLLSLRKAVALASRERQKPRAKQLVASTESRGEFERFRGECACHPRGAARGGKPSSATESLGLRRDSQNALGITGDSSKDAESRTWDSAQSRTAADSRGGFKLPVHDRFGPLAGPLRVARWGCDRHGLLTGRAESAFSRPSSRQTSIRSRWILEGSVPVVGLGKSPRRDVAAASP